MELLIDFLKQNEVEHKRNFILSRASYVRIGGKADVAVFPKDEQMLIKLVDYLYLRKIPYKILGRMTNVLASDEGFHGVIIFTGALSQVKISDGYFTAEAGASLSYVIRRLSWSGFSGLEELYGIPASIGGAVYNNSGAFGKDISSALLYSRVYSPDEQKIRVLSSYDMKFSYRESVLSSEDFVLLSGAFAFSAIDPILSQKKINDVVEQRKRTQPTGTLNLGSVFRRENGVSLAYLIDMAGLKGKRIGDAEISEKHAGFIVNRKSATAKDYSALINLIKQTVYEKYGFYPKEEIEYL